MGGSWKHGYPYVEDQIVWGKPLKVNIASYRTADWYGRVGFLCRAQGDLKLAHERMDGWNPWIRAMIKPGMTVIDCGANEGFTSCVFAKAVGPKGRVFAIEADANNVALIHKNVELNGLTNVTVVHRCLDEVTGEARQFGAECVQSEHSRAAGFGADNVQTVETLALDDLESIGGPAVADVVKIDVEGMELPVLRGAKKLIASGAAFEVEMHLDPGGGVNMKTMYDYDPLEIMSILRAAGYTLRIDGREMGIGELPQSGCIWASRNERIMHATVEKNQR